MRRPVSAVSIGSAVVCAVLFGAAGARAEGIAVAPRVSTLGLGGEVIVGVVKDLNVRGGINVFNADLDATISDISYNAEIDLLSYSMLADWHIFGGSFRITGGALINKNKAALTSSPSGTIVIGGTPYEVANMGTLTGRATYDNEIAPYLGIGWGNAIDGKGRFGLLFDIGAVYTGAPTISLTADGPLASDPTFQQSMAEEQRDAQDSANRFKFYPVAGLSLYYRF